MPVKPTLLLESDATEGLAVQLVLAQALEVESGGQAWESGLAALALESVVLT